MGLVPRLVEEVGASCQLSAKRTKLASYISAFASSHAAPQNLIARFLDTVGPHAVPDCVGERLHLGHSDPQVRSCGGIVTVEDFVGGSGGVLGGCLELTGKEGAHEWVRV